MAKPTTATKTSRASTQTAPEKIRAASRGVLFPLMSVSNLDVIDNRNINYEYKLLRYSRGMARAKKAAPSRLGRPPAAQVESRKAQLLDAATEVFLEAGFAGAKMTAIAKRAGASMETLYDRYPTKEELFVALIERKSSRLLHLVGPLSADRMPREALTHYAVELVAMMTMPDTQKLHRLVIAGSIGTPELGEMFWKAGPGRGFNTIRTYLNEQNLCGNLSIENVDQATGLFMGMMLGGIALRATLGMRTLIHSEPERRAWANYVVDMFLKMLA